jgi:prepilin signal peptidase PulO-like enzyme (type II secretory pathway)
MIFALLFIFGAALGSFLNVIAVRLQERRPFLFNRSQCQHCARVLRWYQLIPVVSYIAIRGKCSACKKPISIQYLLVELATGGLFVLGGVVVTTAFDALLYVVVVSFFLILFLYDYKTYLVPDKVAIPGIIIIGFLNVFSGALLNSILLGGVFGGAWFLAQFILSRGKWVGGGDIRLGMLMGVLLGHPLIWLGLGAAYIGGSVIALGLMLTRRKSLKSRLPFATLLLPASFVVWLWGDSLWAWYSQLIGL